MRSLGGCGGEEVVVLSGGVFQNRRLLEAVAAGLDAPGLGVLVPERLPPGDGGISYGQAPWPPRGWPRGDSTEASR